MARKAKSGDRIGEKTRDLDGFDYNATAELFLGRITPVKRRPKREQKHAQRSKRFATAADAVRFVVEGLPAAVLPGTCLVVEGARLGVEEIQSLYDGAAYPLPRAIETC